jgi:DNA-binding response OmpR family regulator
LIDQEPNFRHSLAIGLRQSGCEVTEATNYFEAENLLRNQNFDGIILDIEPVLRDWQSIVEYVTYRQPESQLIFTSTFNYSELYPFLLEWGERPFFVKPFDSREILEIFRKERVLNLM